MALYTTEMEELCPDFNYKYILDKILENTEQIIAYTKEIIFQRQIKVQGVSEHFVSQETAEGVYTQETRLQPYSQFTEMEELNLHQDYQPTPEKTFDANEQMTLSTETKDVTPEGQADLQTPTDYLTDKKPIGGEQNNIKEDSTLFYRQSIETLDDSKMTVIKLDATSKKMKMDVQP